MPQDSGGLGDRPQPPAVSHAYQNGPRSKCRESAAALSEGAVTRCCRIGSANQPASTSAVGARLSHLPCISRNRSELPADLVGSGGGTRPNLRTCQGYDVTTSGLDTVKR